MPDLVYTIRTPAELEGAQQAEVALEKQIGKAKALGRDYTDLEAKLVTVRESIKRYTESQQAQAAPMEKAITDAERYTQKLQEMAVAQEEAARAAKASAEAQAESWGTVAAPKETSDADRYQQKLMEMAVTQETVRREKQAATETSERAFAQAREEAKGMDELAEKMGFLGMKAGDTKKLVNELGQSFPEVATLARLAMNPTVASLMLVLGAFAAAKKGLQDWEAELDAAGDRAANSGNKIAEAIEQATRADRFDPQAVREYYTTLADGAQQYRDRVNEVTQAIREQERADLERINAGAAKKMAEIDLAEATGRVSAPEAISARQQVREAARKEKIDRENKADADELAALAERAAGEQRGLQNLQQQKAALDANAQRRDVMLQPSGLGASIEQDKAEIARLQEELKGAAQKTQQANDALDEELRKRKLGYDNNAAVSLAQSRLADAQSSEDDVKNQLNLRERSRKQSEDRLARLKQEQEAANKIEELLKEQAKIVEETNRALERKRDEVNRNTSNRQTIGGLETDTERAKMETDLTKQAAEAREKQKREEEQKEREEKRQRRELGQDADRDIDRDRPSGRNDLSAVEGALKEFGGTVVANTDRLLAVVDQLNAAAEKQSQQISNVAGRVQDNLNA
jgi:hypothetical protein